MKNQLTIDQRVHNGIKKIVECYSDKSLVCSKINLISYKDKIRRPQDIDKVQVEMVDMATNKTVYFISELDIEGEFIDLSIEHHDTPYPGFLFEWPLNHSLDKCIHNIIDEKGAIDNNLGIAIHFDSGINVNPEFDVVITYSVSNVRSVLNMRDLLVYNY